MQKECCKESGLWVPMKYKCIEREGHAKGTTAKDDLEQISGCMVWDSRDSKGF